MAVGQGPQPVHRAPAPSAQAACGSGNVEGELARGIRSIAALQGAEELAYLVDRGIDTVIIVGGATSNCIRATVFDSSSYNFRTIVPQEAVFDRIPISHAISLFDMNRQFADVVPIEEVLDFIRRR